MFETVVFIALVLLSNSLSFLLASKANGKDRRVHYSADDDFEDLSLDDLRMLASLDHQTCDECRSRAIYCDGTQPFCLNNAHLKSLKLQQLT